jgi:hypothetical protein
MEPAIPINYWAILVAVVVVMPVGFLWFGPLFGKSWTAHMGMDDEPAPDGAAMGRSLALFALGNLLMCFVLAHAQGVWRAGAWGLSPDVSDAYLALNSAGFTWLGFFLPNQMGRVAWEGKRWALVAINSGFDLVRLSIFAFILAVWD